MKSLSKSIKEGVNKSLFSETDIKKLADDVAKVILKQSRVFAYKPCFDVVDNCGRIDEGETEYIALFIDFDWESNRPLCLKARKDISTDVKNLLNKFKSKGILYEENYRGDITALIGNEMFFKANANDGGFCIECCVNSNGVLTKEQSIFMRQLQTCRGFNENTYDDSIYTD